MSISGTQDGIDQVFIVLHQLHPDRLATSGMTPGRRRLLNSWQRAVDYVVPLRNWHWRYEEADIPVVGPHTEITLPTPWGNEGRDGVFWNKTTQTPLGWTSLRDIVNMQQRYPTETGTPRHYSVRNNVALIFPGSAGDQEYHVHYQKKKPVLEDTNSVTGEGYDNGGLQMIPAQWWETVLYEFVAGLEMKHTGNITEAAVQKTLLDEMVFTMVTEETQGKTVPDYMPRFPGSASVWEVE